METGKSPSIPESQATFEKEFQTILELKVQKGFRIPKLAAAEEKNDRDVRFHPHDDPQSCRKHLKSVAQRQKKKMKRANNDASKDRETSVTRRLDVRKVLRDELKDDVEKAKCKFLRAKDDLARHVKQWKKEDLLPTNAETAVQTSRNVLDKSWQKEYLQKLQSRFYEEKSSNQSVVTRSPLPAKHVEAMNKNSSSYNLLNESLRGLEKGEQINEVVVESYLGLFAKQFSSTKCVLFSTYVWSKLASDENLYLVTRLLGGTKKNNFVEDDFSESHKIFVPINLLLQKLDKKSIGHWLLLQLDVQTTTATIYDSINSGFVMSADILEFLDKLSCHLKRPSNRDLFSATWTVNLDGACSQQKPSSNDCGIYTCLFVKHLAMEGLPFLTEEEILNGRQFIKDALISSNSLI